MGAHSDQVERRGSWFGYLVFISLAFLVVALYRADYLVIPHIRSFAALAISLLLVFVGFVGQGLAWYTLLKRTEYRASARDCIAGTGLSVFTRYIPGKVMPVVGRAAYLAQHRNMPLGRLSMLSLNAQLISLWTGLTLGGIALALVEWIPGWRWLCWVLWGALTVIIFSDRAHEQGSQILKRVAKRELRLPRLEFTSVLTVLPHFAGFWLCWSAGFYFLVVSLHAGEVPPIVGLAFPLATTLGIAALPVPGGLGVREGVLAGLLVVVGFAVSDATTYAVAARLWFLLGETFMFVAGWGAHRGSTR
jgi:uncharacterized membrane protein YbhN (UPF0104 family)